MCGIFESSVKSETNNPQFSPCGFSKYKRCEANKYLLTWASYVINALIKAESSLKAVRLRHRSSIFRTKGAKWDRNSARAQREKENPQ